MRVAYLLTSLGAGGAERQVLGLARRMAERGHVVKLFVLLPPGSGDLSVDTTASLFEIVHLNMRKNLLSVAAGMRYGLGELRRFGPDLVHSHNFHGNIVARLLAAVTGTPLISTIHNVYEGGWLRMLAYRLTDSLSCRTVAVSEAARERYVRLGAVSAAKSGVIANGIEMEAFTPDPVRRVKSRAALGAGGDFLWIAVGRVVPAKDYPNLLRALAQVRGAGASVKLVVAGAGGYAYAEQLRELGRSLGLGESVQWLGLRGDLPALLDAADGFVLSSAWEGMPLALGEAMAMEKPVVATDVGGVRELVGPGALLVPAGDSEALAGAMLRVMRLGLLEREVIGRAGRERILEGFDMDAQALKWEQAYRAAVL